MTYWHATFILMYALGALSILWYIAIGILWLVRGRHQREILPPPVYDERDRLAEWKRILDETQS